MQIGGLEVLSLRFVYTKTPRNKDQNEEERLAPILSELFALVPFLKSATYYNF